MRKIVSSFFLFLPLFLLAQREVIPANLGWQFHYNDSSFIENVVEVNLPHDFLIGQDWIAPGADEKADHSDMAANVRSRLSSRGFKEMSIGWYRKVFTPKDEWRGKRVLVNFGGIMLVGDVFLNGERIGGTDYGYLGFEVDITQKLKYGQPNTIHVKADTGQPNNSRWYTGGGLYRDVNFIITDNQLYFQRHPLFVRTEANRQVLIQAEISRYSQQTEGDVLVRILDNNGAEVITQRQKLRYNLKTRTAEYQLNPLTLPDAHLWSVEDPYLYTAEVTLFNAEGQPTDMVKERFGVRTIEFSPDFGFRLNGKKVILKGIANHHTLGALGAAAFPKAIEKRIRLLKSFGFNHIRTSHNPYSEDLYRLCDEYGILVVDELYDKWLKQYSGGRVDWTSQWQYDLPEWVKRDRNHPSVIFWSLGNELQTYTNLPFNDWGVTAYKLQRELLHRYDTTRLVTVAMHPRGRNLETDSLPCDLAMVTDIQAYNYRYMYFPGDGKRFPWMKFYQSEANITNMGPNYFDMNLDKVIGLAYWGMIDYIGESKGWPQKGWADGVFDISLQPKPMAYFLKSYFSDEPVVRIGIEEKGGGKMEWNGIQFTGDRITEHWNRIDGQSYTVYTYTNAQEVELFVNGKSIGTKYNSTESKSRNKIRWENVSYQKGNIEAVARTNGKVVARHKVETSGKPVKLKLVPEDNIWNADGMDLMHVRVIAVDSKGNKAVDANSMVEFSIEGDASIVAVDNGDMTCHDINTQPRIHLYNGSALVILRAGTNPSKVSLKANTDNLKTKLQIVSK